MLEDKSGNPIEREVDWKTITDKWQQREAESSSQPNPESRPDEELNSPADDGDDDNLLRKAYYHTFAALITNAVWLNPIRIGSIYLPRGLVKVSNTKLFTMKLCDRKCDKFMKSTLFYKNVKANNVTFRC